MCGYHFPMHTHKSERRQHEAKKRNVVICKVGSAWNHYAFQFLCQAGHIYINITQDQAQGQAQARQ